MLQFERVSLTLGTLCGAIPLDNYLANDYDDTGGFDYYRQFEKEDTIQQDHIEDDSSILDSDSEGGQGSDLEDDDVMQMLLSVNDLDEEEGEENGSADRTPSLHGNAEGDSRNSDDGSHPTPKMIVESEAGGSRLDDPLQSTAAMRREAALEKLHMACTRLSGTVEALHFEFIEESVSNIKCILTVTIPMHAGVSTRSYSTSSPLATRSDAKGEAARIAIDMGVIDFVKSASSSASANITRDRAALLARVLENQASFHLDLEAGSKAVQDIARLCAEWRVGVTPEYILYRQRKGKERETGCALRIALTSHAMRVFSTSTEFTDPEVAKMACALIAQEEGVLDYIRYGNGQKAKPQQPEPATAISKTPSYTQMSVQEFFEALPRPFVEPIDEGKTASEIQWANVLNMIIQGAKMHGLKTTFYFTDTETRTGLTGCVLRIVVSDPSVLSIVSNSGKELVKTYVVDPHFVKTNDAKTAACMVAITQNLRGFLTDISKTYEEATQHSREFDRRVSEVTLRTITKLSKGKAPVFEYVNSVKPNGFGCSLTIDLSSNPEEPDKRTFSTQSMHYGSKPDARIAALVEAAKGGVIEQLLFQSENEPPAGYRKFWDVVSQGQVYQLPMAQDDEENGKAQKKKRKRSGAQKPGTKGIAKKASGSEPGEISENEARSPTKHVKPSRIRRSMSAVSNQPSTAPAVQKHHKNGSVASSSSAAEYRRRPAPPAIHPPVFHKPHYEEPRGRYEGMSMQGSDVPPFPPRAVYHHSPLTHARAPAHLAIPPPHQDYPYPGALPYSHPPEFAPSPTASRLEPGPYPFSPSLAYQQPPPHPQQHPSSHPTPPQHTPTGYPYPYPHPAPHPSSMRHNHHLHRPPSPPPHPGFHHERYPAQYPAHMIPRDVDRSRDFGPYTGKRQREDYPMLDAATEEAWRRGPSRPEQGPRVFQKRGRYERPPEAYPY